MEEYIGIIKMFAGNFAPEGWMICNGALLEISKYSQLYAIIGNVYGGDGRTTFALPDLQGRVPAGVGNGYGIDPVVLGQKFGENYIMLSQSNLPPHSHSGMGNITLYASSSAGSGLETNPSNAYFGPGEVYTSNNQSVAMQQVQANITTASAGVGNPFSKNQPSIGINYIICVEGLFPSRP